MQNLNQTKNQELVRLTSFKSADQQVPSQLAPVSRLLKNSLLQNLQVAPQRQLSAVEKLSN